MAKNNAERLPRVTIPVSKRNFNRAKFQTMTKKEVLRREGFAVTDDGFVCIDDKMIRIEAIDLYAKKKEFPLPPKKADPVETAASDS